MHFNERLNILGEGEGGRVSAFILFPGYLDWPSVS